MSSPLHQRAKRIYAAVLELPAAQREGYLDRECADDAALRAEVDGKQRQWEEWRFEAALKSARAMEQA